MKSNREEILKEVETLEQEIIQLENNKEKPKNNIKNLNNEIIVLANEIKVIIQTMQKDNLELSKAINSEYSNSIIHERLDNFHNYFISIYKNKYNLEMTVFNSKNTNWEIEKKIWAENLKSKEIEQIILEHTFKHNKFFIKFWRILVANVTLLIGFFNGVGAFKYGTDYNDKFNLLGWVLIGIAGVFALIGLVKLGLVSNVYPKDVVKLIKSEDSAEMSENLEFLNSINKLPVEIKDKIK
jgi:hypothetical protein